MSSVLELENEARSADRDERAPSLHGTLADSLRAYTAAEAVSTELIGKNAPELHERPETTAESVFKLRAARRLDTVRFADITALEAATNFGEVAHSEGVVRPKRGRINADGLVSAGTGSNLRLGDRELDSLAMSAFAAETSFSFRAPLFLSPELMEKIRLRDNPEQQWQSAPENEKRSDIQSGYEISLALGELRHSKPEAYALIMRSSQTLKTLGDGSVKPALTGLPIAFQRSFIEAQKDIAWSWRNQLEPGKADRPAPELSLREVAKRNKLGLGMMEYLLQAGKEPLEYLRAFGQKLDQASVLFRRTEISEEHFNRPLVGVPLKDEQILAGTPLLLDHLAREHHELWRFTRELSWLETDKSWHEPPRNAHKPWEELDTATRNRDVLNVFGVSYMLGLMKEADFNLLAASAVPGNPYSFSFRSIEILSDTA